MTGQLELFGVPDVAVRHGPVRCVQVYTDRPERRVYLWWRGRHRRVRNVRVRLAGVL